MPRTLKETNEKPKTLSSNGQQTPSTPLYEQSRDQRIKENRERMQKLGLIDLSQKITAAVRPKRTPRHSCSDSPRSTPVVPSGPIRRSSRLKNSTPVSYSEFLSSKKDNSLDHKGVKLDEGSMPEVYTEEHDKRLGNTQRSWTFFDGSRIYDPLKGKTCHQCRQKTLGHRTKCSECNLVQGQFCGDCLYMRYGEHVLEALENPNWICPVCRGICNCSLCRKAKGWHPTGSLYKKISSLGFKSVAHYLIQTRRAQPTLVKSPDTVNQASAKRSLSFSDGESLLKDFPQVDGNELEKISQDGKENNMQHSSYPSTDNHASTESLLLFPNTITKSKNVDSTEVDMKTPKHFGLSILQLEEETNEFKGDEKVKLHYLANDNDIALESCLKSSKKRDVIEPSPDSIAGRLRQRRRKGNDHNVIELPSVSGEKLDVKQALSDILSGKEKEMPMSDGNPQLVSRQAVDAEVDLDRKAGSSKQIETEEEIKMKLASSATPALTALLGN